jgi:Domain of unknown function (DUF4278)
MNRILVHSITFKRLILMFLKYRGIFYDAGAQFRQVQMHRIASRMITLTYRGSSYWVNVEAIDRLSHLQRSGTYLKYRGIPYRAYLSFGHYCRPVLSAIARTYRGTSYLIERSANDRDTHSHVAEKVLTYRGALYHCI